MEKINFGGHYNNNPADKTKSLANWGIMVDNFSGGGKHDTWDLKTVILTGLKTLRIKSSLLWKGGHDPYSAGLKVGGWMNTEWPK